MPRAHIPNVTAIVVSFNSAHALPACLTALSGAGVAAIVVDNASTDASADVAETLGARVIRSDVNLGYGRANTLGVAAAETAYVLICNPDAIVLPGAVEAMLRAARDWPQAGLFGPRLIEGGRTARARTSFLTTQAPPPADDDDGRGDLPVSMLMGACLLMRRDLYVTMGGFDPNIFLFYEDDDLCRRLLDRGHALIRVGGAVVLHGLGQSSRSVPGMARLSRYHQAWSKIYVARKYGRPSPVPGLLVVNALKYGLALLSGDARRRERYGGTLAGAWAALSTSSPTDPRLGDERQP